MSTELIVPEEIADALINHRLVMVIGRNFYCAQLGMPSEAEIIQGLIHKSNGWETCPVCQQGDRCQHPASCALTFTSAVSNAMLGELSYNEVVRFLIETFDSPISENTILSLLAQLPLHAAITNVMDQRIEMAAKSQTEPSSIRNMRRCQPISTNEQISSLDVNALQIIHLYGDINDPKSLILSDLDARNPFAKRDLIENWLRACLIDKVCIFLGEDAIDPCLKSLYYDINRDLGKLAKKPFLLTQKQAIRSDIAFQLVHADAENFLNALVRMAASQSASPNADEMPSEQLPDEPYKFLDYFESRDRAIFMGREAETRELTSQIIGQKSTVLYSLSGRGKSSLLHAGVIPRLAFEGFAVHMLRLSDESNAQMDELIRSEFNGEAKPVLIIDQAEELFTTRTATQSREFVSKIAAYLNDADSKLRLLLSLRIEYIGQLEDLFGELGQADLLKSRYRLRSLGPQGAKQAIVKPAELFKINFESELVERLLIYLETVQFDPPQLQVLCYQLYHNALRLRDADKPSDLKITLEQFNELGGVDHIFEEFLNDALERLAVKLQDSTAKDQAKTLLKNMLTAEQTKVPLNPTEIAKAVSYQAINEDQVRKLLLGLQAERIVRALEDGRYEIAHDTLVKKVWGWLDDSDKARLNAKTLLRNGMEAFVRDGQLLGADDQTAIEQAATTMSLSAQELGLLLMSVVWINQRNRAKQWLILLEAAPFLKNEVVRLLQDCQKHKLPDVRGCAGSAYVLANRRDTRVQLQDFLIRHFSLNEFYRLCLYLDIDPENLAGNNKSLIARSLITHMESAAITDVLLRLILEELPNLVASVGCELYVTLQPSDAYLTAAELNELFSNGELKVLCDQLGISYDDLRVDGGKFDYARNIVNNLKRNSRLDEIKLLIANERPHVHSLPDQLRYFLELRFDLEQLRTLCFYLDINYEDLHSSKKSVLIEDLISYCDRKKKSDLLINSLLSIGQSGNDRFDVWLHKFIKARFSFDELADLVYEYLELDPDQIIGKNLDSKAREVILYAKHIQQISNLTYGILKERPDAKELWGMLITEATEAQQEKNLLRAIFNEHHLGNTPKSSTKNFLNIPVDATLVQTICRILDSMFTDEEFQNLCFSLDVDYESLAGRRKRQLVRYFEQRNTLSQLADKIQELRPHTSEFIQKALQNDLKQSTNERTSGTTP